MKQNHIKLINTLASDSFSRLNNITLNRKFNLLNASGFSFLQMNNSSFVAWYIAMAERK